MTVVKVNKSDGFTVMSNHHLRNSALSFKARGLLSFMLSCPPSWDFSVEGLQRCAKDGRDSINSGLNELEKAGYLIRQKVRDKNGSFAGIEYVLYELPQTVATSGKEKEAVHEPLEKMDTGSGKSETQKMDADSENVINTTFSPSTENPSMVKNEQILPFTENPFTGNPSAGKPFTDKPLTENPQQINTNIINTKLLNTKEINTDKLSSSDDEQTAIQKQSDDLEAVKRRLGYQEAVKASSSEIARIVFKEISGHGDLLKRINADIFKRVCENIWTHSKKISNQNAYIHTCIENMLEASKINSETFHGIWYGTHHPPEPEKKDKEIKVYT